MKDTHESRQRKKQKLKRPFQIILSKNIVGSSKNLYQYLSALRCDLSSSFYIFLLRSIKSPSLAQRDTHTPPQPQQQNVYSSSHQFTTMPSVLSLAITSSPLPFTFHRLLRHRNSPEMPQIGHFLRLLRSKLRRERFRSRSRSRSRYRGA